MPFCLDAKVRGSRLLIEATIFGVGPERTIVVGGLAKSGARVPLIEQEEHIVGNADSFDFPAINDD